MVGQSEAGDLCLPVHAWALRKDQEPTAAAMSVRDMGVSIVMGVPQNGWCIMEKILQKWMMTGGSPMTSETSIYPTKSWFSAPNLATVFIQLEESQKYKSRSFF